MILGIHFGFWVAKVYLALKRAYILTVTLLKVWAFATVKFSHGFYREKLVTAFPLLNHV